MACACKYSLECVHEGLLLTLLAITLLRCASCGAFPTVITHLVWHVASVACELLTHIKAPDFDFISHCFVGRGRSVERCSPLLSPDSFCCCVFRVLTGSSEHALPLFYAILPRAILEAHPEIEEALCINQQVGYVLLNTLGTLA